MGKQRVELSNKFRVLCQKIYVKGAVALASLVVQIMLFSGVLLLGHGLHELSIADTLPRSNSTSGIFDNGLLGIPGKILNGNNGSSSTSGGQITPATPPQFVDSEIRFAVCQLYALIEGSFGALLMTVAGIGAIMGAAFGAYKAATSLIVVACGSFILRSLVSLFFGDPTACPGGVGGFRGGFYGGGGGISFGGKDWGVSIPF